MTDHYRLIRERLDAAQNSETAAEALQQLRSVLIGVGKLIDEQLVVAVVDDELSIAAAGKNAGLSENAVGPRLASTSRLAPYVTGGGRITAEDIKQARRDKYAGTPLPPAQPAQPMRFKPRRTTRPS